VRAALCRSFSAADPLAGLSVTDVGDRPQPPGWVTVRLRAAALNAHDLWSLRGVGLTPRDLPRVLGSDGAGIAGAAGEQDRDVVVYPVVAAHPPESPAFLDPRTAPLLSERHDGTLAQQVRVPAHNLLRKPAHLTFEQAAALPTAWLTAYRMLFTLAGARPGDTVLVQGATGGVATALVVLGVNAGVRMWVTGRSDQGRAWAAEQGADATFAPGARLPERVDAVMETVGEATWAHSLRCVRVGGTVVVAGATSGPGPVEELQRVFFNQISIVGTRMGTLGEMRALLALVERKGLVPPVDSTFALDDAPRAFRRLLEGNLRGKVVVSVAS
jgi:NADPH:quinone reductase-like Zn-dependent oxidoreductase